MGYTGGLAFGMSLRVWFWIATGVGAYLRVAATAT